MKSLVIVESPAKAKTINKYLGKDFKVLASYGHVRDLLPKTGAVETDNNFVMHYETIARNKKHVDAIIKALEPADTLLLATDPDREGEAISWHLYELLKAKKKLKDKTVKRVVFHEITKTAVLEAVANPRDLAMDLVNAQQARRALDYLVGFNLSPLLWKKIRRGLSAGRVQSPALRLIVERELEIEKFESQEYWTIEADVAQQKQPFVAKLNIWQDKKLQQFDINNEKRAKEVTEQALTAANGILTVTNVDKKQRKRQPAAPFTTSTIQQEAARKLGFTTRKTMQISQQLYEGIELGADGPVGLITYMRTDSVALSQEAVGDIRTYIEKHYGNEFLPASARVFKNKSKNAQEAHEAIRATAVERTPDSLKNALSEDQFKLYNLIWKRTLACQMVHAVINTVAIDMTAGIKDNFRANGSVVAKPGFMRVYQEGIDDQKAKDTEDKLLPPVEAGDKLALKTIRPEQHFTEPPPRYSEASLVKTLEEFGIGRPSTYASIIATIQQREYVKLEKKRFYPTDVGRIVTKFLTEYFTKYVDYDFTAALEDDLDAVAEGSKKWIPVLENFWKPFTKQIDEIEASVKRSDVTSEAIDENCPECSKQLQIKLGRNGRFIGCTGYPDCKFTKPLPGADEEESVAPEIVEGRKCPKCEHDLVIKVGRYGKFIGCSNYPECKHMEPLHKPVKTDVTCPSCKEGEILERKSRRGKIFYSCEHYPKCKYALWNKPLVQECPKCKWPIMTEKVTKKHGTQHICPECQHTETIEAPE